LASCAAAAQLLLRLLERSTVVAADGIRLIRYYQPLSDSGCNKAAGNGVKKEPSFVTILRGGH
jgi:hypothetical protein